MWIQLIAAAVFAGFLASGGFALGLHMKEAEWNAAKLAKKEGEEAALQAAARAITKIGLKSETHIQPLLTEVRTNTVYRDCAHTPDSLRNLNALITGDE